MKTPQNNKFRMETEIVTDKITLNKDVVKALRFDYTYEICAENPGIVMTILGGIHGDERCGYEVVNELLRDFSDGKLVLQRGKLRLALGNLEALKANKRYCKYNLNRLFRSDQAAIESCYESSRALELMEFLKGTEVLFDIHSTTEPSPPFLLCESFILPDAKQFCPYPIVSGWCQLGDPSVAGDTESYINGLGGQAYTFESGWKGWDGSFACAYEIALDVLAHYGLILPRSKKNNSGQPYELFAVQNLLRGNFSYARKFQSFDKLSAGQLIGSDSEQEFRAPHDCVIIMPANPLEKKIGEDLFFLANLLA